MATLFPPATVIAGMTIQAVKLDTMPIGLDMANLLTSARVVTF
jgi:hypothetical protein